MKVSAIQSLNYYNQNQYVQNKNQSHSTPAFGDNLFYFDVANNAGSVIKWSAKKLRILKRNDKQMLELAEELHLVKNKKLAEMYSDHDGFWGYIFKKDENKKSTKAQKKLEPYLKLVREYRELCFKTINELKAKPALTTDERIKLKANQAEIVRLNTKAKEAEKYYG